MSVRTGVRSREWQRQRRIWLATTTETHCWLREECGGRYVNRGLPRWHPWSASADHEVPVLLGGPELPSDGAVLRLAHLRCNVARSNRLRARLRHSKDARNRPKWTRRDRP